jgi:hypothetical protein
VTALDIKLLPTLRALQLAFSWQSHFASVSKLCACHGSGHRLNAESKLVGKDQECSLPETALQSEKKEELDNSDMFCVVVTSDNHLGYSCDNPLCTKDRSYNLNGIS